MNKVTTATGILVWLSISDAAFIKPAKAKAPFVHQADQGSSNGGALDLGDPGIGPGVLDIDLSGLESYPTNTEVTSGMSESHSSLRPQMGRATRIEPLDTAEDTAQNLDMANEIEPFDADNDNNAKAGRDVGLSQASEKLPELAPPLSASKSAGGSETSSGASQQDDGPPTSGGEEGASEQDDGQLTSRGEDESGDSVAFGLSSQQAPPSSRYVKLKRGTCKSEGYKMVTTFAGCVAASKFLNVPLTGGATPKRISQATLTQGCIASLGYSLIFNSRVKQNGCSKYAECLCEIPSPPTTSKPVPPTATTKPVEEGHQLQVKVLDKTGTILILSKSAGPNLRSNVEADILEFLRAKRWSNIQGGNETSKIKFEWYVGDTYLPPGEDQTLHRPGEDSKTKVSWWTRVKNTVMSVVRTKTEKESEADECPQWWCRRDVECRIEIEAEEGLDPDVVKYVRTLDLPPRGLEKVEDNIQENGIFKLEQLGEDPSIKDKILEGVDLPKGKGLKLDRELMDEGNKEEAEIEKKGACDDANNDCVSEEEKKYERDEKMLSKAHENLKSTQMENNNRLKAVNKLSQKRAADLEADVAAEEAKIQKELAEVKMNEATLNLNAGKQSVAAFVKSRGGHDDGHKLSFLDLLRKNGVFRGLVLSNRPWDLSPAEKSIAVAFKQSAVKLGASVLESFVLVSGQDSTVEKSFEFSTASQLAKASKVISSLGVSASTSSTLDFGVSASGSFWGLEGSASMADSDEISNVEANKNKGSNSSFAAEMGHEYYKVEVMSEPRARLQLDFDMMEPSLSLGRAIEKFIKDVNLDPGAVSRAKTAYKRLIKRFGTHVCPSVVLGGMWELRAKFVSKVKKSGAEMSRSCTEAISTALSHATSGAAELSYSNFVGSASAMGSGGSGNAEQENKKEGSGSKTKDLNESTSERTDVEQEWKGGASGLSPALWRESLSRQRNSNWKIIDTNVDQCIAHWEWVRPEILGADFFEKGYRRGGALGFDFATKVAPKDGKPAGPGTLKMKAKPTEGPFKDVRQAMFEAYRNIYFPSGSFRMKFDVDSADAFTAIRQGGFGEGKDDCNKGDLSQTLKDKSCKGEMKCWQKDQNYSFPLAGKDEVVKVGCDGYACCTELRNFPLDHFCDIEGLKNLCAKGMECNGGRCKFPTPPPPPPSPPPAPPPLVVEPPLKACRVEVFGSFFCKHRLFDMSTTSNIKYLNKVHFFQKSIGSKSYKVSGNCVKVTFEDDDDGSGLANRQDLVVDGGNKPCANFDRDFWNDIASIKVVLVQVRTWFNGPYADDVAGMGDLLILFSYETVEECAAVCRGFDECKSFEHSPTGVCNLNTLATRTGTKYQDYSLYIRKTSRPSSPRPAPLYHKAVAAANCPTGKMVNTEEGCKAAGKALNLPDYHIYGNANTHGPRPAGCFWDSNYPSSTFFNGNFDTTASLSGSPGAICYV